MDARAVRWRAFLVFVVALVAYANAVPSSYAYDDRMVVLNSPVVQGNEPPASAFVRDFWGHPPRYTVGSYRPLPVVSLALEWRFLGKKPWFSHLVNVLLHGLVAAGVYLFWRRMAPERVALAAALLDAVLCAPSESVQGIVGRADLFESLGLLVAAAAHRRGGAKAAALAVTAWFLALLSKESALFAPAAFLALDLFVPAEVPVRARLGRWGAYAAATAAYFALRIEAIGAIAIRPAEVLYNPLVAAGTVGRVFGAGRILLEWYLQGFLLPWRRLYDCSLQACTASDPSDPWAWLGIACFLGLLALPLVLRKRAPVAAAGLAWFAVFFVPVSNFLVKATLSYGERLLYVPSLGLCIALACAAEGLVSRGVRVRFAYAPLAIFALVNAGALQLRHLDWRNDATLAASGLRYGAKSVVVQQNNASAAIERGDPAAAEGFARRAVELVPTDPYAHKLLGLAEHLQGRQAEAEAEFREAYTLAAGRMPEIAADYASFLARQRRYAEALQVIRAQLLRDPDEPLLRELERRLAARTGGVAAPGGGP